MKLLGKNRNGTPDGAIDSLIRAYVSRPGNRDCSEFDADLANAYIERNLIPASRARYEQHLSECGACRKNVVELSRLVEPEARPVISARSDSRSAGRRVFGVTSWARWAIAAAAVIVLAISLPLLLTSNNNNRVAQEGSQAAPESQAADNTQAVNSPEKSPAAATRQAVVSSPEPQKPSDKRPVDAVSANGASASQQSTGAGGDRVASNSKLEAKAEPKPAEQAPAAAGSQPVSELAAGQEKRSDQDSSSRARQQQPSKDSAVADTKSGSDEQDKENARKKTQVAENAAPPPPPSAPGVKAGKMKRSSAIRALRGDSASADAVRPTERKLGNKKFSLKDDTWTDKDFDPDKDLPIVTVIRDSNVYNELLAKQVGLKPYLGGFPPAERAIIVYKGTVYKLIPQQ